MSDEALARSLHEGELEGLRSRRQAASAAPPYRSLPGGSPTSGGAAAPATASPIRKVTVVIDGMNIMRSTGFVDSEFVGPRRDEFERLRREDNVRDKPAMALALVLAIEHCLRASAQAKDAGEPIVYEPMAFVVREARPPRTFARATVLLA